MPKNALPPGVEAFLSSETGPQIHSALRDLYDSIMLDTATKSSLNNRSIDLGIPRPPVLFGADDLWRAVVRTMAYGRKHTRPAVANLFSLILGPKISQVTVLDRTNYSQIASGNSLTISVGSVANVGGSPYTVNEVLTHHLIFPAGTFTDVPDLNVTYAIEGTTSPYGNIVALSDGRQALVDTTVTFVNTVQFDYVTQLNTSIPQYGRLIFDKNSTTTQEKLAYEYYDNDLSGILKLNSTTSPPDKTRNKYVRMRSSVLSASVQTGALSVELQVDTNFPTSPALVPTIQIGDQITVLSPTFAAPIAITGVTANDITVAAGLPVPASPTTTEQTYIVHTAGSTELNGGRGHFLSKKGKILSGTRLVDYSKDLTEPIKPYVTGSSEPFSIVINRGENNEETIEVLSRVGRTLNLVLDPKNKLNTSSLLQYNHDKGETIEVVTKESYSTGSYFALNAAGLTVGTATGGTLTSLIDATAPFVVQNADAVVDWVTHGDEVEIVTTVGGGPAVGETRTVVARPAATTITVSPAFTGATIVGCTYRIRKLYKPRPTATTGITNEDQYLYLADTSMFPAADFSVILDRGTTQEEVVWIDENDLARRRLRIANGDWWDGSGAANPYLTKTHYFGVTVEPAQVLVESCPWEIIETQATGEFTLALDGACIPDITPKDAWYLHEKTPAHLVNTSNFGATEIGEVRGNDVVGALPLAITSIPRAAPANNIAAGSSTFTLTHANYVRLLANFYNPFDGGTGENIFRPIFVKDGNGEEEAFATSLNSDTLKSYGILTSNALVGDTEIVVTNISPGLGDDIVLGQWGSKYRNHIETRTTHAVTPAVEVIKIVSGTTLTVTAPPALVGTYTVSSVEKNRLIFPSGTFPVFAVGGVDYSIGAISSTGASVLPIDGNEALTDNAVNFLQPNWEPNQWKLTLAAGLTYPHFKGESVNLDPVTININGAFKNNYVAGPAFYVYYTYSHPTYRRKSDLLLDPAFPGGLIETSDLATYPANTGYVRRTGAEFSRYVVDDEIYIKSAGAAAPHGERRSVQAVGGINNEVLFVGEHTQFSATVDDGDEFDVRSFLQSGDIADSIKFDISDNANDALGAPGAGLNLVNLERYAGGHKSIFPGSYLYRLLNIDSSPADQPSEQRTSVRSTPDPSDLTAIYKFPGPRRLIAPPAVPYAAEDVLEADNNKLQSAEINIAGDLEGKYVEILAPTDSRDYRRILKITAHAGSVITLDQDLVDKPAIGLLPYEFRVLGDGNALDPITPTSGSPYFWVDYPEVFPDPAQNDFTVILDRNGSKSEEIQIISCINTLGANYGRFTISSIEAVDGTFLKGTSIELKIEKIALDLAGITTDNNGGFYLGFGFEPDHYRVKQIGLGADPAISGEGKGNTVDKFAAGAHPPTLYTGSEKEIINRGMYNIISGGLSLPTPTLSDTRVRCNIISQVTGGGSVTIQISDFNFLKQKYRSFLGGEVLSYFTDDKHIITDIDPSTSSIRVVPPFVVPPVPGAPIVLLAAKVPTDDKERQSDTDNYFTFSKYLGPAAVGEGTEHFGIFPTITTTSATVNTVRSEDSVFSTALIGHRLIYLTTGGPVPQYEQRPIVGITEHGVGGGYDTIVVSPNFTGIPVVTNVFAIIPPEDFKYSNIADRAGGVYTGINSPDPVNPAGTRYPAHINGVSREYGIVQEYVEYSSRSGNILTLSEPFYPRYDHLPNSTVVIGTNQFTSEGYGNDYRPFLTTSYLSMLFDGNVVNLKSLFCAAGIDGKTEVTELGS